MGRVDARAAHTRHLCVARATRKHFLFGEAEGGPSRPERSSSVRAELESLRRFHASVGISNPMAHADSA